MLGQTQRYKETTKDLFEVLVLKEQSTLISFLVPLHIVDSD